MVRISQKREVSVAPLSDAITTALAKLVDDSQEEGWREPNHSDIDELVLRANLDEADPRKKGQPFGKAKRIRAILNWALENNHSAGEFFVGALISIIRGYGGFRDSSPNYVGKDAIQSAVHAFRTEGYNLSSDGELLPMVLDNLTEDELTDALMAYVRRARKGILDAALLAGTGKDLLEAVAKHVLNVKWNQDDKILDFPTLLGQAFVSIDMTTPEHKKNLKMNSLSKYECALYELGCAVNSLRNKEGTGHGRPFLASITPEEASNAVQAIGLISEYMLRKLKSV